MQRGGYPVAADDLTMEEWMDLGLLKQALNSPVQCPLLTGRRDPRQSE